MTATFSQDCKDVITLARNETRRAKDSYVRAEHLLLGLFGVVDGVAATALNALGVELWQARARFQDTARNRHNFREDAPLSEDASIVLELAAIEARVLGSEEVKTEHMLLAFAREPGGALESALKTLKLDPDHVAREVFRLIDGRDDRVPATV